MKRLALAGLLSASLALGLTAPSQAGPPPTWSFDRVSFGVDAQGAQWSGATNGTSFLPGAYLSYDATSGLSFAGTLQRDFARHTTIGKAGARFKVWANDRGAVAVGANLVGYGDQTAWLGIVKPTSWETTVNGAYGIWQKQGRTIAWGIAGASYDKDNNVKEVRVGLRWQAVGGKDIQ